MISNSIDEHIDAEQRAITMQMDRAVNKEIILIVEGEEDLSLFHNVFGVPERNIFPCDGKENLMEVYNLLPFEGFDDGTFFIRDADFDNIISHHKGNVPLIVTDGYDVEMLFLSGGLFYRILFGFLKASQRPHASKINAEIWGRIVSCAAIIGALKKYNHENGLDYKFCDITYSKFVADNVTCEIKTFVTYMQSHNKKSLKDVEKIVHKLEEILKENNENNLVSGKDIIPILRIALDKHLKCDKKHASKDEALTLVLSVSAHIDDIIKSKFYSSIKQAVDNSNYIWIGRDLIASAS